MSTNERSIIIRILPIHDTELGGPFECMSLCGSLNLMEVILIGITDAEVRPELYKAAVAW